jgi:hypothetical protein
MNISLKIPPKSSLRSRNNKYLANLDNSQSIEYSKVIGPVLLDGKDFLDVDLLKKLQ